MTDRMQITDRYVRRLGVGVVLGAWGIVLAQPIALLGAAGIGAWLLAAQYRFVRDVRATTDHLSVTQTVDRPRLTATESTLGTIDVQTARPAPLFITARPTPPISSDTTAAPCELPAGERTAQESFESTWPVAGRYAFDPPTVTFADRRGLFRHVIRTGATPTVMVEPRAPRAIHVGAGGDRITSGFGEHDTGRTGSGLKPAELRQYQPGDAAQQIDWKATARLAEPYVREFEAQTDLETVLLVDHRHTMGEGPDGETKLAFARQVALAIVASAQELGDPLGCYTVGDAGVTTTVAPRTTAGHYRTVTDRLHDLAPTSVDPTAPGDAAVAPARARRLATQLPDTEAFGTRLKPFFEATDTYVRRVADRPLFEAARLATARHSGTTRTIIITDDEDRTALRETVNLARRGGGTVVVYLTPSALFASASVREIDTMYQRYTQFEQFRRDLMTLQRVSAFEVGPSDRLAAVLAAGDRQRRRRAKL
jgi:uncharacterized protein (DUF58 family)